MEPIYSLMSCDMDGNLSSMTWAWNNDVCVAQYSVLQRNVLVLWVIKY